MLGQQPILYLNAYDSSKSIRQVDEALHYFELYLFTQRKLLLYHWEANNTMMIN